MCGFRQNLRKFPIPEGSRSSLRFNVSLRLDATLAKNEKPELRARGVIRSPDLLSLMSPYLGLFNGGSVDDLPSRALGLQRKSFAAGMAAGSQNNRQNLPEAEPQPNRRAQAAAISVSIGCVTSAGYGWKESHAVGGYPTALQRLNAPSIVIGPMKTSSTPVPR